MKKYIAGACIYIFMWILNSGAILAQSAHTHSNLNRKSDWQMDHAFALGWCLMPPALLFTPLLTDFYADGFCFTRKCWQAGKAITAANEAKGLYD